MGALCFVCLVVGQGFFVAFGGFHRLLWIVRHQLVQRFGPFGMLCLCSSVCLGAPRAPWVSGGLLLRGVPVLLGFLLGVAVLL